MAFVAVSPLAYQYSGTTCAIPVPTGAAAGHIAVADIWVAWAASLGTVTPPAGFTLDSSVTYNSTGGLGATPCHYITIYRFWKRLVAADTGTYTFTTSVATQNEAACSLWSGRIATGSPFDTGTGATATVAATSDTAVACPNVSITPTVAGCDLSYAVDAWNGTLAAATVTAGWTISNQAGHLNAYKQNQPATSSGNVATSGSDIWIALLSALLPVVATPSGIPTAYLSGQTALQDSEMTIDVTGAVNGATQHVYIAQRSDGTYTAGGQPYYGYFLSLFGSTSTFTVVRNLAGVSTTLATPALTEQTGAVLHVRFRVQGAVISVKVWYGGSEPGSWTWTGTDGSPYRIAGKLSLSCSTTGQQVTFDNLAVNSLGGISQPANSLSITDYGAIGTDSSDDTTAITNCIAAAQSQGKDVWVPPGTFYYTTFHFNGITMSGAGPTSILYAPTVASSMVVLDGNGPELRNLKVWVNGTVRTGADHAVFVEGATNFVIDNCEVQGAGSASILMYGGCGPGQVTNNYVHDGFSDGIHHTNRTHDVVTANNVVRGNGDDMIAVVSYSYDTTQVTNILVQNNDVAGNTWGRGLSVIGGQNVTIQGNTVANSAAAGIMVATESSYNSLSVANVMIKNNHLTHDSTVTVNHAAIHVSGGNTGTTIDRTRIESNIIDDPVNSAIKLEYTNSNTAIINNTITDPEGQGIVLSAGTNIYGTGNTLNGSATGSFTGVLNFTVTGSSLTYP